MIQLILMLLGLAFGNNNANTTNCDNGNTVTTQSGGTGINPGMGTDPGDTGGDTGHKPPTIIPKP